MKVGNLLSDVEGLATLAALGLAGFLVWKGVASTKAIGNLANDLSTKIATTITSVKQEFQQATTKAEVVQKALIAPDSTIQIDSTGKDAAGIRRDAVTLLEGLRTAQAVRDTLPQNVIPSLWRDLTDWYAADTTGKAVRDSFYNRNPDGVFYD